MDFPLDLKQLNFISGMDELKQDIIILVREQVGNFLQSPSLGAKFDIHSSDEDTVKLGVQKTLEDITGVSVKDIQVELPNVSVTINYYDDIVKFQFSIENED